MLCDVTLAGGVDQDIKVEDNRVNSPLLLSKIHMHVEKHQPILVRVLLVCQTFFRCNFVNHLKRTFLQILTFSCLQTQSPSKFSDDCLIYRKLRSVFASQRPATHVLSSFLYMIGFFVGRQT